MSLHATLKKIDYLTLLAYLLCVSTHLQAQQASPLSGYVRTSDLDPIRNATIKIDGVASVYHSDADGYYFIPNLKDGTHRFLILYGKDTILNKELLVKILQNKSFDIEVAPNANQLREVTVVSGKPRYTQTSSEFVSKLPLKNIENPQSYSTINKAVIEEQVITDFSDVLKNATGVYKVSGNRFINTGGGSQYTIRGFNTEVSMVDGIPSQTNAEYDPSFVERVEILKGPSATLYGGALTTFGGMVNIVTKRPKPYSEGEVSLSAGSYGLTRASIDKYGIIDGKKAFMYRINGAYQYQNSFQDAGFKKSFFIAPSFRYQPNERLYVDLDFTYNSSEGTNPVAIYLNRTRALIAKDPDALNFDWKRSYTSNDITIKTPTVNARALINYRILKGWTSQTIVSSNTRKSNGFYQYEFMRMSTDDSLQRTFSYQNTVNQNIDVQQNFISDFYIGKFRNRLLVGLDYLRQNVNNDNSPYIVYDTVMGTLGTTKSYGKLFAYNLENRLANTMANSTNNNSHINIFSAYASDVFNITEHLLVMASLRVDRYANLGTTNSLTNTMTANSRFNQTAFSPKFGLVYEIIPNQLSAFANYLNGFSNVSPVNQPLPEYSGILKPQHANQYEGGLKLHLISGKLDLTTSYYNIEVNNMSTIMNVEKDNQSYAITVQDGTQKSRGFEFDLTANPISGLNILAGYGYNNSKYVKSASATQGLRPNSAGPSNLANLWASYRLLKGRAKGLGLGFGGNYIGKNYSVNSATIGTFTFPDYVLLNASLFYDINHLHLAVKLNNLTNEHYFTGQTVVSPQMPRNFIATIGYSL